MLEVHPLSQSRNSLPSSLGPKVLAQRARCLSQGRKVGKWGSLFLKLEVNIHSQLPEFLQSQRKHLIPQARHMGPLHPPLEDPSLGPPFPLFALLTPSQNPLKSQFERHLLEESFLIPA